MGTTGLTFSTTRKYTNFTSLSVTYPDPTVTDVYQDDGSTDGCWVVAPTYGVIAKGVEAILLVEPHAAGADDTAIVDLWLLDQHIDDALPGNPAAQEGTWIPFATGISLTSLPQGGPFALKIAPQAIMYVRIRAVSSPAPASVRIGFRPAAGNITGTAENPVVVAASSVPAGADVANNIQAVLPRPFVGPLYSPVAYSSLGGATHANIKAAPAQLLGFTYEHIETFVVYFGVYDKASDVATNDVPIYSWLVEPSSATSQGIKVGTEFFGQGGKYLGIGLTWGVSSDPSKYTAIAGTASKHTVNMSWL